MGVVLLSLRGDCDGVTFLRVIILLGSPTLNLLKETWLFTISFIKVGSHFLEVPKVMVNYHMALQSHGKLKALVQVPKVNLKIKNCLLTSGITVLRRN